MFGQLVLARQLTAGRDRLREATAAPVAGNAVRLPFAGQTVDGIISVEAAFHFRSRKAFFAECYRVLRPGGVLSIPLVSAYRVLRNPRECAWAFISATNASSEPASQPARPPAMAGG